MHTRALGVRGGLRLAPAWRATVPAARRHAKEHVENVLRGQLFGVLRLGAPLLLLLLRPAAVPK